MLIHCEPWAAGLRITAVGVFTQVAAQGQGKREEAKDGNSVGSLFKTVIRHHMTVEHEHDQSEITVIIVKPN